MTIERVGVVGFGQMGSGIAQVCATSGIPVIACEVEQRFLDGGFKRIESSLGRLVTSGRLSSDEGTRVRGRIRGALDLAELRDCDLVIEAVVETADAKKAVFAELDRLCHESTIFASNTSSLTIVELAASTRRQDRFAGLHFFNPPPVMRLVEIARALTTSEETVAVLRAFVERIGHTPVVCADTPGFVVNRLLVPYLLSAIRALENGVAGVEEIDQAVKLGLRHPMGPFELLDYTGLDTVLHVSHQFFDELHTPDVAPPALLKRMVLAGRLGLKTGIGFYRYDPEGKRQPIGGAAARDVQKEPKTHARA